MDDIINRLPSITLEVARLQAENMRLYAWQTRQWQPIDTCPKNGSHFLGSCGGESVYCMW